MAERKLPWLRSEGLVVVEMSKKSSNWGQNDWTHTTQPTTQMCLTYKDNNNHCTVLCDYDAPQLQQSHESPLITAVAVAQLSSSFQTYKLLNERENVQKQGYHSYLHLEATELSWWLMFSTPSVLQMTPSSSPSQTLNLKKQRLL